jgi:hypothetical protein
MSTMDIIYSLVESQYFDSGDFNGLSIKMLADVMDNDIDELRDIIKEAITNEVIEARFNDNTHIRAFSNAPNKEKQLEYLATMDFPGHICLYPHSNMLANSPKLEKYNDSPYEYELAKGGGQLDFRTFDLSVLEYYRNDPSYSFRTDFIHGEIYINDTYYETGTIRKHDQIILQTFGFAYDNDLNRYVAVFLRYLADLTPEHQKVWLAKEVKGDIKLHPDYYVSSIQGSWGIIAEKPHLFRHTYHDERPKEFGFLLRPTEAEFNKFMLLLDKMLSDNINKKFFEGDIELESEETRDDDKIVVTQKGTIQLLEQWIYKYFTPAEEQPVKDMLSTFRKVRKLRQKPAHKVESDTFDQAIFKKQRDIVINAYVAVRMLRLILANHPKVRANPPDISEQLSKGEIWDI